MALLVLSAALVFMWQGRQALVEQQTVFVGDLTRVSGELEDTEAYRQGEIGARTSLETDVARNEQEIVDLQQTVIVMAATATSVAMPTESVATETPEIDMSPPIIEIVYPRPDQVINPGDLEFIAYVSHSQGITEAVLSLNDSPLEPLDLPDNGMYGLIKTTLPFEMAGTYELTLVVTSSVGIPSTPSVIFIEVVAPEEPEPESNLGDGGKVAAAPLLGRLGGLFLFPSVHLGN